MPLKRQSLEYCHGFFGASNTYRFDNEKWQSQLIRNDSIIRTVFYFDDYEEIAENGCTYSQYFLDNNVIVIKRNGSFEFYQGFTDHLGNILDVYDSNGQAVFEARYDAWGRQTVTKNNIGLRYGYTGHEMLPEFGLIDMKGRVYDPAIGRFLSPDNFVQEPTNSQSFNRYAYCVNNPLKYTDPSGEAWWLIPVIGATLFSTGNTIAHCIKGDIKHFGDAFKFFSQGAAVGFALGCAWQFVPNLIGVKYGTIMQNAMTWYAKLQVASGTAGMVIGGFTSGWQGIGRGAEILLGNLYLDDDNWWCGVLGGTSRHTWEILQSLTGHTYTQFRNAFGGASRVDYFGGNTYVTNEETDKAYGISMGNFINLKIKEQITIDFATYVNTHPMLMHEYGHTFDSKLLGPFYLLGIGIPSILNTKNHHYWTEIRANRWAKKYFHRRYNVNWDDFEYYYPTF